MRTIEELRKSDKTVLTSYEVAPLLGMHPHTLTLMARAGTLPFKTFLSGNRVKIPRLPLIEYLTK